MAEHTSAVGMERKLAAIFSTDVAGYSRLMGDDEEATIRTLTACRAVISSLIQHYRGRVVDAPGDNLLAEFASVVDAVRCAVEIQQELKVKNAALPPHRQMQFRIGINLGDVIVEGERLYGDGVNIAARMESLAEPGGICIAGTVYDQVKNKVALGYEYLGEREVKNIAEPVRVYRVRWEDEESQKAKDSARQKTEDLANQKSKVKAQKAKVENRVGNAYRSWPVVALAGGLFTAATFVTVHYLSFPTSTQPLAPSTQPAPPSLPLPDKPSLVVLPFVNMSNDPDQEYFSDGFTEDLTSDLSRISSLFVIARNSAFTYKGKAVKVQEVSKELGVQYVLEGSVQKADGRVRINAQLVDATTGHHLWAERYDRELKDIFALQDEIGQKIVLALKVKLTPEEQERFKRFPTDNLEAYDVFMRGVAPYYRFTKEANIQARQLFERAIVVDPQYAGAYAWLGWTYFNDWTLQWSPDPQNLERAFELAQRAVALDDSQPDAHQLLSWVYLYGKQQPEQALAEAERAIALDPNYADSYVVQAHVLSIVGRPEEAIGLAEKALRLNPRGPAAAWYLWELGFAYRLAGRVEEAIATLKQTLMYDPNYQFAYTYLALSYVWQWVWQLRQDPQTLEQALAAAQRAIALNDSLSWAHSALASVYLWKKQYDQAAAEAERAIALDSNVGDGYATLAEILIAVGKPEEALRMAEKAVRIGVPNRHWYLPQLGQAYCMTGQYAEASATLKQFISRTPNLLHAQLVLAIAASEAAREEEAQAAAAEVLRINPQFSLEVHKQRVPIKDPAVLERHITALRKAGLK